jgi:hypothetical protein
MRRLLRSTILAVMGAAAVFACSDEPKPQPRPLILLEIQPQPRKPPRKPEVEAEAPLAPVMAPLAVDLGEVTANEEISFEVPPNALGFNVVVEADDPNAMTSLGILSIRSPSGELVHDSYMPKGGNHVTSAATTSFGAMASASVPQSEVPVANPPAPGTWTIRFGAETAHAGDAGAPPAGEPGALVAPAMTYHAKANIQVGPSAGFMGGRLDLLVYVPTGLEIDGHKLDAADAALDGGVGVRLDVFFSTFSELFGIDRGQVTFVTTSGTFRYVDSAEKLVSAFGVSRGEADTQALHMVLTNAIEYGGDTGIAAWGIAPGIPGAANRAGTTLSGIIVAVGETPAVGDGRTMAHEAGHFFGLNHTTEYVSGMSDPLADTPKCDAISAPGADYSVLDTCPDKLNVMFPAHINPKSAVAEVSQAQRLIVRGSPIYKAYKQPPGAQPAGPSVFQPQPRETPSLAKSGRALTAVERALAVSLCPHGTGLAGPAGAGSLFRADDQQALAELRHASADPDLPRMMRRQAAAALRSIAK